MITDIIILKGTILLGNIDFCLSSNLFYIKAQIKNKEHIKLNKNKKDNFLKLSFLTAYIYYLL